MSFSVDWTPVAEAHLTSIWLNYVAHRQEVSAASVRIDELLAVSPLQDGATLSEGLYVINVAPLRALYEVSADKKQVTVVSVSWLP